MDVMIEPVSISQVVVGTVRVHDINREKVSVNKMAFLNIYGYVRVGWYQRMYFHDG